MFLNGICKLEAAPRSLGWARVGLVDVPRVKFCFLSKRVSFWRQMGSRLIRSTGKNNSGFGSNKDYKREARRLVFHPGGSQGGFK